MLKLDVLKLLFHCQTTSLCLHWYELCFHETVKQIWWTETLFTHVSIIVSNQIKSNWELNTSISFYYIPKQVQSTSVAWENLKIHSLWLWAAKKKTQTSSSRAVRWAIYPGVVELLCHYNSLSYGQSLFCPLCLPPPFLRCEMIGVICPSPLSHSWLITLSAIQYEFTSGLAA